MLKVLAQARMFPLIALTAAGVFSGFISLWLKRLSFGLEVETAARLLTVGGVLLLTFMAVAIAVFVRTIHALDRSSRIK